MSKLKHILFTDTNLKHAEELMKIDDRSFSYIVKQALEEKAARDLKEDKALQNHE